MKAIPIVRSENTLGEAPLWHSIHQILYWVDIESRVVHGFEPHTQQHREWPVPQMVGTVACASNGNLILGLQSEIAELNPVTAELKTLASLEADLPENRCNDGKCDPAGRLWVGTLHIKTTPGKGSLYCIDSKLQVTRVLHGLTIANGMAWSPDGNSMYFIDSADRKVRCYDFDPRSTSLRNERIVLAVDNDKEVADGMCADKEGMLWIGFYGGHRVGRYDPCTGKHLADIKVPAPNVTSCCFGGQDLKTLYITTATQGLTTEQLAEFPLSGSLFSCETETTGMESDLFGSPRSSAL